MTGIGVVSRGATLDRTDLTAGLVGKVWGLREIRVGDEIGRHEVAAERHDFAPPTLETVVVPRRVADRPALRDALTQLAEQDPLIDVRQDDSHQISLSLYGEVQREVIGATLAAEYGVEVDFRESTVIHVERPVSTGEAVEVLNTPTNPFHATIGLRVEPGPVDSGVRFGLDIDPQTAPLYLFKNIAGFTEALRRHVDRTFHEGLSGWRVTDCVVTLVECGYSLADGPLSKRGPMPTHADFRNLIPLVLMAALDRAGTAVCAPYLRVVVEVPADSASAVLGGLARLGAAVEGQSSGPELTTIRSRLAAARLTDFQRQLPRLTGGEGVLESGFAGYQPVVGTPPVRRRTTVNPLDRAAYMAAPTRQDPKD